MACCNLADDWCSAFLTLAANTSLATTGSTTQPCILPLTPRIPSHTTAGAKEDKDDMDFALGMLDKYQGQVTALFCADEVFCGRSPHRGKAICSSSQ
jgi:hypothetical protein